MRRALQLLALVVAGAALVAPAAAAPSHATKTPAQWIAASLAASKAASSVHVVANAPGMGFDLRLVAGKGGAGWILQDKQKIDIVRIGTSAYFRAGAAFWRKYGNETAAQLFAGRWVKMPADTAGFESFVEITDIPHFFAGLLGSHGALKLGRTKTIDGTKAIALVDTAKDGGTLWVAATGKPYPLELRPPSGPGDVRFESWNRPLQVTAPRDFVDFSKLKK